MAVGAFFFAAPVLSVRLLGLDSATAKRVTWLARMTAARDGALGAGTLAAAASGRGARSWMLAGSFCDAADAAVLVAALRSGRLKGLAATAITAGAAAAAVLGAAATADVLRNR